MKHVRKKIIEVTLEDKESSIVTQEWHDLHLLIVPFFYWNFFDDLLTEICDLTLLIQNNIGLNNTYVTQ